MLIAASSAGPKPELHTEIDRRTATPQPHPESGSVGPAAVGRIGSGDLPSIPDAQVHQSSHRQPDQFRRFADSTCAWRPFAAMVVTGLSLPLAYWSRTLVPTILAKARASLPAPAHRPKSLPGELGA